MALKTIFVKGRGIGKEAVAGGTILPGSLVALASTGKVAVHAVAGGRAAMMFARENELASLGIATAYSANDTCYYESALPGFEINSYVAASAAAIVIGDFLESDGAGGLRKATELTAAAGTPVTTGIIADVSASPTQTTINNALATIASKVDYPGAVAVALQAVNNSANGASIARILVEVL